VNRPRRKKPKWDAQPTSAAGVLLASDGQSRFSARAVAQAAILAGSRGVAVLTIAKIYGTSFGLPHPGLLPTKGEMKERIGWVDDAIARLDRKGVTADGQVASTRRAAKAIANVARVRGVETVVMDETEAVGWRRTLQGDIAERVSKVLRPDGIDVKIVKRAGQSGKRPAQRHAGR
jgi:nucleotide-binding universal stress UspA family protein